MLRTMPIQPALVLTSALVILIAPLRVIADCNQNGIPDSDDISAGTSSDCDTNGVPDECTWNDERSPFPSALAENSTGCDDAFFTGAPEDNYMGIGGHIVTYLFDASPVVNLPGPDLVVYELDHGTPEFAYIDVLVSLNGTDFVSIKATESAAVHIPGDESHGSTIYARSYDLTAAGLGTARFVRIDGSNSLNPSFDLDAIGAVHVLEMDCNENGILDACDLAAGTSQDCNLNLILDACEVDEDCNANGMQDICDIAGRTSFDCNGNAVPDECEILGMCDPPSTARCPDGDVNCDGIINDLDVAYITSSGTFGMRTCAAAFRRADCNKDGMVNGLDVAMCVSSACWGL